MDAAERLHMPAGGGFYIWPMRVLWFLRGSFGEFQFSLQSHVTGESDAGPPNARMIDISRREMAFSSTVTTEAPDFLLVNQHQCVPHFFQGHSALNNHILLGE